MPQRYPPVSSKGTHHHAGTAIADIYMASVSVRPVHCVELGEMASERAVRVYSKARQSLDTVTGPIVNCLASGRIEKLLVHGDAKTGH